MIRAAGYLRVSSAQQRDRVTIESQRRDVPAYIAAMGREFAGPYENAGHTAKAGHLDARDGFARLRAAIIPERIDVVVVVALDRLTRSEDPVERATRSSGPARRCPTSSSPRSAARSATSRACRSSRRSASSGSSRAATA